VETGGKKAVDQQRELGVSNADRRPKIRSSYG
jgi:hypothetical protein